MSNNSLTTFALSSVSPETGVTRLYEVEIFLPPLHLAGQDYRFEPDVAPAQLSITYVGHGYAVALRFCCHLTGACWRCLEEAKMDIDVEVEDFFETELPPLEEIGEQEEASLWYSEDGLINLSEWARDAVSEMLPPKILCDPGCRGLCAQCGANLNLTPCHCKPPTDSRWDKLKDFQEG